MYGLTHERPVGTVDMRPLDQPGLATYLQKAGPFIGNLVGSQGFEAAFGSHFLVPGSDGLTDHVLVGTDQPPDDPRHQLHLFARLAGSLSPVCVYRVQPGDWPQLDLEQAALGWGLARYKFQMKQQSSVPEFPILCLPESIDINRLNHILDAMFMARDLINTPAGDLAPQGLVKKATELAEHHGAALEVIQGKQLLEQGYPTIYAVGMGSSRPPALIDLRWGRPEDPKVTLVGKGVVFDTGGLDLKSPSGMILMKKDMGGAGVTLALARLIMEQGLRLRLRLLVPTVENAIGPDCYRPGDVIQTRKGLTVEVGNTDAEGRLILCDALTEAVTEEPELLIDMATLTGAARIALGQDLPAFWTPSETLAQGLTTASAKSVDPIWRMPLWEPYLDGLARGFTDLNNIADTPQGGSITAALFLYQFVKPFDRWVHFDIYGWRLKPLPGSPKGGEASALRAVFQYLNDRYPAKN